jgi:hypothetical protein
VPSYKTISGYKASKKSSIEFLEGDILVTGEEYEDNPNSIGWIKCTHSITGKEGWVTRQILRIHGDQGKALCDYSAKELTIKKSAIVEVLKSMNGWSWCRTESGEEGWLPNEVVGI